MKELFGTIKKGNLILRSFSYVGTQQYNITEKYCKCEKVNFFRKSIFLNSFYYPKIFYSTENIQGYVFIAFLKIFLNLTF